MSADMYNHSPAPWYWYGNASNQTLYLASGAKRKFVMQFARWGNQGAQPRFEVNMRMVDAKELVQFEVGNPDVVGVSAAINDSSVYRYDIIGVSHPDAMLIAAAPDLLKERDALKAANAELLEALNKIKRNTPRHFLFLPTSDDFDLADEYLSRAGSSYEEKVQTITSFNYGTQMKYIAHICDETLQKHEVKV